MRRGRMGAGGRRPAGAEVPAVASESPGAASPEPRLLLPAAGEGRRHAQGERLVFSNCIRK